MAVAAAVIRAVAVLAILAPLVGFAAFVAIAGRPPDEPERTTAGIAVLTGGAERLETGLRLLLEGRAERLLISGTHPDVTLADLARIVGVPEASLTARVALGRGATSTRGNAAEVAAWARAERLASVRVVTAGYHMPRALLELRRDLRGVALVAHPVVPARLRGPAAFGQWRTWTLLGGEYLKLLAAAAGLAGGGPGEGMPEPPSLRAGRA